MSSIGRRKRSITYKERSNSKSRLEKQGTNWSDLPRDIVAIGRRKRSITYFQKQGTNCSDLPRDIVAIGRRKRSKQGINWSDLSRDTVAIGRKKRSITSFQKQGTNWSDLPRDIVECIIVHLDWADRIRIRAVCKAWSVPNLHIPTIDTVPWAMRNFYWMGTENGDWECVCGLIDPFSRQYPVEGGKKCRIFLDREPCASVYGWVLFKVSIFQLYMYSPFTTEAIKLPKLDIYEPFQVATFSLNATSPKSVIFLLHVDNYNRKVCVQLCSAGDYSWKIFEFNNDFDETNRAACATYADGVFYCVFTQGQLGAFNVELEEWTILAHHPPPNQSYYYDAKLVVSGLDLLLWNRSDSESWELCKFDFLDMRWVYENNLNNHVLFIGCTSFSVPAVGRINQLANTIFYCDWWNPVTFYGSRSPSGNESLVYRRCVQAAKCAGAWIQLPLGGIWRANELINAV